LALTSEQINFLVDIFPYDDEYALYDFKTGEAWIDQVFCLDMNKMYRRSDFKKEALTKKKALEDEAGSESESEAFCQLA